MRRNKTERDFNAGLEHVK